MHCTRRVLPTPATLPVAPHQPLPIHRPWPRITAPILRRWRTVAHERSSASRPLVPGRTSASFASRGPSPRYPPDWIAGTHALTFDFRRCQLNVKRSTAPSCWATKTYRRPIEHRCEFGPCTGKTEDTTCDFVVHDTPAAIALCTHGGTWICRRHLCLWGYAPISRSQQLLYHHHSNFADGTLTVRGAAIRGHFTWPAAQFGRRQARRIPLPGRPDRAFGR